MSRGSAGQDGELARNTLSGSGPSGPDRERRGGFAARHTSSGVRRPLCGSSGTRQGSRSFAAAVCPGRILAGRATTDAGGGRAGEEWKRAYREPIEQRRREGCGQAGLGAKPLVIVQEFRPSHSSTQIVLAITSIVEREIDKQSEGGCRQSGPWDHRNARAGRHQVVNEAFWQIRISLLVLNARFYACPRVLVWIDDSFLLFPMSHRIQTGLSGWELDRENAGPLVPNAVEHAGIDLPVDVFSFFGLQSD